MRLTTVGRRSGKERSVILGYYEDGPNLVTMAMNGWADAEPAWWLNLQAQPDARSSCPRHARVRGRAAQGDEHERLWARGTSWATTSTATPAAIDGTAVVVLEPKPTPGADPSRG